MRAFRTLLTLPSTLLSLLLCQTTHAAEIRDELVLEQHDSIWKRDQDALSRLANQQPQGVRKMSNDPGEKFWIHYWDFGDATSVNVTTPDAALALHSNPLSGLAGRAIFARDASCPSGYSSCSSIGHSDSCCPSDNTCILVTDTGNGPVGCCAAGKTCGTTVPDCNTSLGYTSCPDSTNKGCCIPGYVCSGNICVNAGTMTVTSTPSTTSTSSSSSTTMQVSVTTLTVTNVNTSGYTTTATVTVTQSSSSTSTNTSASSATAVAPVRPTTDSTSASAIAAASVTTSTSTITTSTSTTTAGSYCPTGYYMCSAVYLGGCCQVDRDCNTTTCPPTATTTVINGAATVVAPTGASSNAESCATGWYSCAASLGGLCCPSGYNCGQTDCPATASGAAAQAKQSPNQATSLALTWSFIMLAVVTAIGMVLL